MTQDEIIRMAREAGFPTYSMNSYEKERLADFAALVAANEREACALMVDKLYHGSYMRSIRDCAAAIRARGE